MRRLFHFSGCNCSKCCELAGNYLVPATEMIGGADTPTAIVHRVDPVRTEQISGRANVRLTTQPAFSGLPDPIRESDYYSHGKDFSHAASRSQIALTATPNAYEAVMADNFVYTGDQAPALKSGLQRGGMSGLSTPRVNIEDTPTIAYGDLAVMTAYGRMLRG